MGKNIDTSINDSIKSYKGVYILYYENKVKPFYGDMDNKLRITYGNGLLVILQ